MRLSGPFREEITMTSKSTPPERKTAAASGLKKQAKQDEIKTEDAKGSPLKKGAERVQERAVAANGKGSVANSNQPQQTSKGNK